jgi:hypothetical protein
MPWSLVLSYSRLAGVHPQGFLSYLKTISVEEARNEADGEEKSQFT